MPEKFNIHLSFMQNYCEPDLQLTVSTEELVLNESLEYMLVYDACKTGKWELVLTHNKNKEMIGLCEFEQKN